MGQTRNGRGDASRISTVHRWQASGLSGLAELAVVDLQDVVEVHGDGLVDRVAELLVELLGQLVALVLQPLGLGAGAPSLDVIAKPVAAGGHLALQRHHVLHAPAQGTPHCSGAGRAGTGTSSACS
jgi:hypothetical protein